MPRKLRSPYQYSPNTTESGVTVGYENSAVMNERTIVIAERYAESSENVTYRIVRGYQDNTVFMISRI